MNSECPHCKGVGKVVYYHGDLDTCPTCHGIPIAEPMRKPRQCQQCNNWGRCTYVKTKYGFRRVCVPCAVLLRDAGNLLMPDRIWPKKTEFVF
jgi:DnaJ-class molecular chaperone